MTKEEAKNKWCPMSFNTPDQKDLLPCSASQCAWWAWEEDSKGREIMTKDGRQGHCGLIRR